MRNVILSRGASGSNGVFGDWKSDSGFSCVTMEKPDLNDAPDISCIPKGQYQVEWQWSQHHGCNLYHVQNVPNRSNIEIHAANVQEQLLGCIAVGYVLAMFTKDSIAPGMPPEDERGVTASKETLAAVEADLRDESGNQVPFVLTIQ